MPGVSLGPCGGDSSRRWRPAAGISGIAAALVEIINIPPVLSEDNVLNILSCHSFEMAINQRTAAFISAAEKHIFHQKQGHVAEISAPKTHLRDVHRALVALRSEFVNLSVLWRVSPRSRV
jgi:hypothetical protein